MRFKTSFGQVIGAALLIAGCCIGAGMIGMPVRTVLAGFMPSTVAMVVCYLFTTMTGLLILEATLWFNGQVNFATIVESTLGGKSKLITLFLYLALFYSIFVAYLDGTGMIFSEIFSALTGLVVPRTVGIVFCAALVAAITYAGTHMVNRINQFLLPGLVITYALLIITGLMHARIPAAPRVSSFMPALNVVPILLISFGYQNLVPSITYYLNKNARFIRYAIIIGNFIPLLVYILWNYVILGILPAAGARTGNVEMVTQLLGGTASVVSVALLVRAFSLFALLTSFIPCAISLVDFVKDSAKNTLSPSARNDIIFLSVVFVPTLLFTLTYPGLFLHMLDFAGGFIDVLLFGVLPAMVVLKGRKTLAVSRQQYQVYGGSVTPILILIFSLLVLSIKIGILHFG